MKPDEESDMVLREPAAAYLVESLSGAAKPERQKTRTRSKLRGGQSIVTDVDEFTAGLIRAFGEAKDKAIRENKPLRANG